ncbi:phosphoribosyltransferase [Fibrobacter sp.]|uniref:phosphoribosyltransferase n=1 Tax=Fibrobacter sp. TaxID=35828 RepID=UPI003862F5D7
MAETCVYRSVANLNDIILKNIDRIPHNIDLVVGIPRSGMLPANLIALYLNKPYTDIDSFIDGRIYGCGYRGSYIQQHGIKNVLIVDDSICSGNAMSKAKAKIQSSGASTQYNIRYGVVYARTDTSHNVDVWLECIDKTRVFEWNLFHHKHILSRSCVDIDGVLCADPLPSQNDDGKNYIQFLKSATPKFIPTVPIKTLVSCRLEKYRTLTEEWLVKHNIQYDKLVLMNMPSAAARRAWGKYGEYKSIEYSNPDYILFIESSLSEATRIKELTHKSVFCTETMRMI